MTPELANRAVPVTSAGPFCILNGHSVHVEEARAQIVRIAREYGADAEVIVTKRGDDIAALAVRAVGARRQPVVAGGGDGTVNAVAGVLAGTATALGVIPMGTLNHFAKDVGLPLNIEAAVRNLFTGRVVHVDVGEVNGHVFVNNSGVGFYPHFVRQREEQERRGYAKRIAAMLAVRSIVRRYFRLRIKLRMDQSDALEHVTPFLFVGNNRYHTSGPKIGTRSTLDSGRLWVCTAPRHGRKNIAGVALRTLISGAANQELKLSKRKRFWWIPGLRVSTCPQMEKSFLWMRHFITKCDLGRLAWSCRSGLSPTLASHPGANLSTRQTG